MLHCPRSKFPCPSPQRSRTHDTYHLNPPRALRSCSHRRCSQRCPDAGGGNLPRYLRARSRRHDPWQLKESRSPRRVGDCGVTSIECNSRDGHSSPNTVERTEWLKRNPRMTIPVNLALILGVSLVALPCAIGAFPQRQRIHVSNLEPEFQDRQDRKGEKIDYVWFNRGV